MDNDDIFAVSDNDKTRVRPAVRPQSRTANEASPARSTPTPQRPVSSNDTMAFAVGDAADTIESIRSSGINAVVAAAAPLLSIINRLQNTLNIADVNHLREQLSQEMQQYETAARNKGVDAQAVLVGRYILCAALDEAILNTPWGSSGAWGHRSLLSIFHKETSGGDKIFVVLDRLLQEPGANINLLELMAVCLALGFKGKYRIDPMGNQRLELLQSNLLTRIAAVRGQTERALSPHWQTNIPPAPPRRSGFPLWVLAAITGAVLVAIYAAFNFSLISSTTPLLSDLDRIGKQAIEEEAR